MAVVKFDIQEAFKQPFGIYSLAPAYFTKGDAQTVQLPDYQAQVAPEPVSEIKSPIGGYLYDAFSVEYEDANVAKVYQMPVPTVAELSRAKNIIRTALQGRNGTVKEYISMGDWQIILRGFIINYDQDLYPEVAVSQLNQVFELNRSVVLNSRQLSLVGIRQVVVEDIRFPSLEGYSNVQPFELQLLSDDDYNLLLE